MLYKKSMWSSVKGNWCYCGKKHGNRHLWHCCGMAVCVVKTPQRVQRYHTKKKKKIEIQKIGNFVFLTLRKKLLEVEFC